MDLIAAARVRLRAVPGLQVLAGPDVDPTKLVVLLAGTGAHGHAVETDLIEQGFPLEMADRDTLVARATLADDESTLAPSLAALINAVEGHRGPARVSIGNGAWTARPTTVGLPRLLVTSQAPDGLPRSPGPEPRSG